MRVAPLAAVVLLALAAAPSRPAAAADGAVPRVTIAHQGLVERYCADLGRPPAGEAAAALARNLPQLQSAWQAQGEALLLATEAAGGADFAFGETVATLHACPGLGSISAPLLIDAGRYFAADADGGPGGELSRRELGHFLYTLWHEVVHRHVGDLLRRRGGSTPLLDRHAGEAPVTLNHLHLFALEQLVWRELGREEEFHARGRAYAERGETSYARAYAIVVAEGAERFAAELSPEG